MSEVPLYALTRIATNMATLSSFTLSFFFSTFDSPKVRSDHSTLGLRVIKKKKDAGCDLDGEACGLPCGETAGQDLARKIQIPSYVGFRD